MQDAQRDGMGSPIKIYGFYLQSLLNEHTISRSVCNFSVSLSIYLFNKEVYNLLNSSKSKVQT